MGWVSVGFCLRGVGFLWVSMGFCLLGVGFHWFPWFLLLFWGGFPCFLLVFFFLSFGGDFPWVLVFLELVSVGSCLPDVVSMGFCLLEVGFCGFPCFFVVLGWVSMSFHRITAWLGFKGTSRTIKFQSPCPRQGCPLLNHILDQVAQSPIQPGIKYLQRVFSKSRNGF